MRDFVLLTEDDILENVHHGIPQAARAEARTSATSPFQLSRQNLTGTWI